MLIDIVAAARPNFIKIVPIIHAIQKKENNIIKYRLIHTSQHYDNNMLIDTVERPETIDIGDKELVGSRLKSLVLFILKIHGKWREDTIPEKWDGKVT